jgi:hypothetical protein
MFTVDAFLNEIEKFLARSGMSATAFGREAVKDPNLVGDLRNKDRMPGLRLIGRVDQFIKTHDRSRSRSRTTN